jgi:hypothetical protein
MPMQKNAISRMLARNAHIPRGHHLNPPQQPKVAKYKTPHKGNHKGWQRDNKQHPHRQINSRASPRGKSAKDHQNTKYIIMNVL